MPLFGDGSEAGMQHASDEDLVLLLDGQLGTRRAAWVRSHLESCWACRTRSTGTQQTIAAFMDAYGTLSAHLDVEIADSSAALRQRLRSEKEAQESSTPCPTTNPKPWWRLRVPSGFALAGALSLLALFSIQVTQHLHMGNQISPAGAEPRPLLTPGETVAATRSQVCSGDLNGSDPVLPANLVHVVLHRYGLSDDRRNEFELDYLITPELGGATSVQNIWPEPYANTPWNAHVKDQLEDHLHKLVCQGELDLRTAQRDMAADWIYSYQKYFGTRSPLRARAKDGAAFTTLAVLGNALPGSYTSAVNPLIRTPAP